MSCATTFIVGSDTGIRVLPGAHLIDGRAVIVVVSDGLTITGAPLGGHAATRPRAARRDRRGQTGRGRRRHATFSDDAVGAAAARCTMTDVASTRARIQRVADGTGQDAAAQDRPAASRWPTRSRRRRRNCSRPAGCGCGCSARRVSSCAPKGCRCAGPPSPSGPALCSTLER